MDSLFKQCPAVMSDGRFITNYNDDVAITQDIRKQHNLESTHDFREFLQKNALKMMQAEFKDSCKPAPKCSFSYPPKATFPKAMPFTQKF